MPSLTDDAVMTRVLTRCPQAPTSIVKLELVDTVIDFYEKTLIKQQALDSITTVVDQPTYAITIPAGFQIIQAMSAKLNKIQIEQMSSDHLDIFWGEISRGYSYNYRNGISFGGLDDPTWRDAYGTMPRIFHFESDGTVRLVAIPTAVYTGASGLIIIAALKPLPTLTTIDDVVWNDCYQTLVDGAIARIASQPEKAWSNEKLAVLHGTRYDDGVQKKADEVLRSMTRNDRQNLHSRCVS